MDEGSRSILFIFLLILLNAFFAASEIAIISLNKNKITQLANEENKKAKMLLELIQEPSKFLTIIQVGITFAGFLASAWTAVSFSSILAAMIQQIEIPFIQMISEEISLVVITMTLAFITLVLGELVPKRLALQYAEEISMFAVKPILLISKLMSPFVKVLMFSTDFFARLFGGGQEAQEEQVTEEEIRIMIDVGEEKGIINETEKEMIDGIFEFDNILAREVMTPRTNVFAMEMNMPVEELVDKVVEEQYSRIPIYENDIDNIIGILYMKDLLGQMRKRKVEDIEIRKILRPAYFVPETKNIDSLFRELQHSQNHMAILIDEYGGVSGILTIEDLLEQIVGNISDEYDEDDKEIEKLDQNTYLVNGLVSINEINQTLDLKLPSDHFDTVGGFVISLIGNIPKEDEEHVVEYENLIFKVEKINEKRIEKLKLCIQSA